MLFDIALLLDPMKKLQATPDAIEHAFHRNGIKGNLSTYKFFAAVAGMHPKKPLYADSIGDCVRIFGHFEYPMLTLNSRIRKLKTQLQFINTPYVLLVEEWRAGFGIDFCLMVKKFKDTSNKKILLPTPDKGGWDSTPQKAYVNNYASFPSYAEELIDLQLNTTYTLHQLNDYPRSLQLDLSRWAEEFDMNDDKFKSSKLYSKVMQFSELPDTVDSAEITRYNSKKLSVRILSETRDRSR